MNESEDSLKQKMTKTHFPEHFHFEPSRLAVPEGGAEILECEQCTPPRNASKGSAEVASNVVAPGLDDDAESNLQASSPKGPKLGGPESLQLDRVDSPACKFVGAGEITEYQVTPFSPEASGARRRLAFDEDSVTTVSDKILSIIDSCLNYATSSREGTQSPITSAYSIVTLSQCLQIPENLSSQGNKIPHHRIFSNSSVRCILGLLKSTPLKDLPAIDGGIRCLLSDTEALGDEVNILKNAVDYLNLLSGPYRIKEQPPTFASMEAQFLKSRAAIEAEISRMTSECSSTATYLREAALQLENCKAIRERADLAAKALEAQLSRVQQEAIAANAKEQEADRKFQRLQESNNQMVMQLGSLVARLEGEETQHRERRAVFDAEESNRMKDLNILDEAAKVTVRLLEELQSQ